jgi:uncharacterized protein
MDSQTGQAALNMVVDAAVRHGYQAIKLKYAGGEPLLNFELVQALHYQATQHAQQSGLGLHEVVLSNGTLLTSEIVDFLREKAVRLMISLDGTGLGHDSQRPAVGLGGSVCKVIRGIDVALEHGLSPHLSITLTGEHIDAAASAVMLALERGLTFNLNFVRDPVARPGTWHVDEISLIEAARRAFQAIEVSLPHHSLVAGVLDRASFVSPHVLPCGAGHHYLVIGSSGEVTGCQMDLDRPVSNIWANDPLGVVRASQRSFANVPVDGRDRCRSCTWRYACGGGCPRLSRQVSGRDGTASPYCQIYRTLYPELVQLEGLRLVQMGACA